MSEEPGEIVSGRKSASKTASTALFLGVVAIVSAVMVVGGVIGIFAVRLGRRAVRAIDEGERRERGRGMAVGGVVLGWMAILVAIGSLAAWVGAARLAGARAEAREVLTEVHMRKILQSCDLYEVDHENAFPPHLAALMEGYGVTPVDLLDARGGTLPMKLPAGAGAGDAGAGGVNWKSFAGEVDRHCDFVYLGGGLRSTDFATDGGAVLVAKARAGNRRLVGCMNGSVQKMSETDFAAAKAITNAARAKRGLKAAK